MGAEREERLVRSSQRVLLEDVCFGPVVKSARKEEMRGCGMFVSGWQVPLLRAARSRCKRAGWDGWSSLTAAQNRAGLPQVPQRECGCRPRRTAHVFVLL